jgi:hypothetical protein
MSERNSFLAKYGDDDHVKSLANSDDDYTLSKGLNENPMVSSDALLHIHQQEVRHSSNSALEHPNFKHFDKVNFYDENVRHHSLYNPNITGDALRKIHASTSNVSIHARVYEHPNVPMDVHDQAFKEGVSPYARRTALSNPKTPVHRLISHIDNGDPTDKSVVLKNKNTPVELLIKHGIETGDKSDHMDVIANPSLPYQYASKAIRDNKGDSAGVTSRLATHALYHPDLSREDLDHHIAHIKHQVWQLDDSVVAKHYPNGYKRQDNTVSTT